MFGPSFSFSGASRNALVCVGVMLSSSCASDEVAKKPVDEQAVAEAAQQKATSAVKAMAEQWWAMTLRRYPEMATSVGVHDYDNKLTDTTPAARSAHAAQVVQFRQVVQDTFAGIDRTLLSEQDAITATLLEQTLDDSIQSHKLGFWALEFNQMGGPQADFSYFITQQHPKATVDDVQNMISRYNGFAAYVDGTIASLREAMKQGLIPPKVIAERVLTQLEGIVAQHVEATSFYVAASSILPGGPEGAKAPLTAILQQAAREVIPPAFVRYRDFVRDEVVPNARDTVGVSALAPRGADMYAHAAASYTTTTLSPDEIHQMGLDELERIEGEMQKLATERGHVGDVRSFLDALRADKSLYAPSREALLETFRAALKRADAKLPEAFNRLPQLPYKVEPLDAAREKDAPAAYYQPGALADGRPGIFVANLHRFEERPVFNSSVLSFHEAVPGHHLQIALAQEIDALPRFRAEGNYTAFVEGWALYSERLADELGLYESLEARVGYLGFAAWRASRLVVDTGIHAKGWTRQHALDFLAAHTTLGPVDVENEIDRYIAWPGQALGYMVGCLKILELRSAAQARQGAEFSLPAFHDAVLLAGAVPLSILEERVTRLLP